jgi:hypothetical protein
MNLSQSKLESLVETCINTAIGFVIAIISQIIVFPMFGIHVPLSSNFGIGAWFTIIGVARGYVIRRWFNGRLRSASVRISEAVGKDQP